MYYLVFLVTDTESVSTLMKRWMPTSHFGNTHVLHISNCDHFKSIQQELNINPFQDKHLEVVS